MALATPEDIATRAGEPLDATEAGTVELLLNQASSLILSEVGGSEEEWVTSYDFDASPPEDVPEAVSHVCIEIAYRAWSNPNALERADIGEVAVTYQRGGESKPNTGAVFLTNAERRTIRKAAQLTGGQSVTLESPYSGPATASELDFA